jgi:geranylgeranyl diphosphate synthase type II
LLAYFNIVAVPDFDNFNSILKKRKPVIGCFLDAIAYTFIAILLLKCISFAHPEKSIMHTFQAISQLFNEYLQRSLPCPEGQESLYEPCRYLINAGGKRVRPSLCIMAADMFNGINDDAMQAALAVELFHNFTLIHDDIMDKAPLRRGMPTVHTKYGLTTGILSGDVMGIFAYKWLGTSSPQYLPQIINAFNTTAIQVCEGQQWDMDFEQMEQVAVDDYIHMITLKTSVLLAVSLQMGAIVSGASEADAQHLYEFGKHLGIAFQLQDDYLDTFGDEAMIGKKPGGDIRSHKKTYLLLKALELADDNQKKVLLQQDNSNDEARVAEVTTLYKTLQVDILSKNIINEYSNQSFQYLQAINIDDEKKQAFQWLAAWLLNREY